MNVSSAQLKLMTLCALAHDGQRLDWSLIAREALAADGVEAHGGRTVPRDVTVSPHSSGADAVVGSGQGASRAARPG